ncbi:SAVED domain-containing protein [Pseudomonas auratipiscis]|uniref:SAVED domain-containing protein n=1 Tax=Pseudomonas auratipiscis TaxID=3115853 RepID=A0AB35WY49_9PSED|nr:MULTISPECIES: SAVED domain-containing protein [unclassified Pseudomonas]MEE1867004.1 SAVED domain-containing protein [Pseudomonas sp. 120P]MEE1957831.1 SAVED domain-containing protein [Pseudomonas sp. 119P]
MLKEELLSWGRKIVDWFVRPKNIGICLIRYGTVVMGASLAGGLAGTIRYISASTQLQANIDTTGGPAAWMAVAAFVVGVLMVIVGVLLNLQDRKQLARQRVLLLEQKGLFKIDSPLDAAVKSTVGGTVDTILVDIREGITEGRISHPETALQKVVDGRGDLVRRLDGQNKNDIQIAYGGLMPVPFTFLTGCLVDDEGGGIKVFDWDRLGAGQWRLIQSGIDDGQRLQTVAALAAPAEEAVLALSISYPVDEPAIATTFPDLPIMHMKMGELSSNAHWSVEKQSALAEQFLQALKGLAGQGVKTIHLVIAAPNSVVFNLGRIYDRRLLPAAIIYQYERSCTPPYPWGVTIPSHSQNQPAIVHTPCHVD